MYHLYAYIHVLIFTYIHSCMSTCTHVCMYTCVHVYMCTYIHVYTCKFINIQTLILYIHVHDTTLVSLYATYIHLKICIHVWIYTLMQTQFDRHQMYGGMTTYRYTCKYFHIYTCVHKHLSLHILLREKC